MSRSEFAHERAGHEHVRELLPDRGPFHAWCNFEFRDRQGKWSEVDLLVLGEGRLHLVELKHYRGALRGNAYRWERGNRSEDSPLILARRKAQRLSSELKAAAARLSLPPERVPFIAECVFLHAEDFTCLLPRSDQDDLFGLDGFEQKSGLPSIADRLLEPDRRRHDRMPLKEEDLLRVIDEAGFAVRRQREVGSWRLTGPPMAEGEGWQDWPAEQLVAKNRARIRFFLVPDGASAAQLEGRRRLVQREYQLTQRLRHDGVLAPRDVVEHELGAGLVFDHDPADQRLDLWLADHGGLALAEQVDLVRQLGEALQYAHANGVVHRGLNPTAVTVHTGRGGPRLLVGDWQVAGLHDEAGDSVLATRGTATRVFGALDGRARAQLGPRATDAYVAPEGQWSPDAHRVKLDVFALGALTYLLVTGQPPAANATELKERLAREQGLDLAADLPEAPPALRRLVLEATNPRVSERLRDVGAFLTRLSEVERGMSAGLGETVLDPLDAPPGTLLGDRFELVRRLGSGSTAVGLLVADQRADGVHRVLKVARDNAAADRLALEAEVLAGLSERKHPRLVRIVDPQPLRVGERTALLLESAGDETLADVLRDRRRLSLDLLERWGTDLLEALVELDHAGVDHRDIKPANLGVREQRSDRAKHLVLFDFSLARASAASLRAGTPPYLDPFLGTGTRSHWDSAAERYAAAVTLFEMATGHAPVYGDGASDPATIPDEATIESGAFDPTISDALVPFFRTALARDARERFGTAEEMLTAWRTALASTATTDADQSDLLAERAQIDTPLNQSGLTPRALSALEPFHLVTVGDLAALDTGRLSRFAGIVDATKREIRSRAKQWREKFGDQLPRRVVHDDEQPATRVDDPLAEPEIAARQLVEAAGGPRAKAKRRTAQVLLGLEGAAPAFGTLADLAGPLRLGGPPQVSQALAAVRDSWAADPAAAHLLDEVAERAATAVADLDGAAWAEDVARAVIPGSVDASALRLAEGLVRAALDRAEDKAKGAEEEPLLVRRRRRADHRLLLSSSVDIAAAAGRLAQVADALVEQAQAEGDAVVPRGRSVPALRRVWTVDLPALDDLRLLRFAARMSEQSAASAHGELYSRALDPVVAARLAFGAIIAGQRFTVEEVHRFVRARFPGLADLPPRPDLDDVLRQAGTGLEWDTDAYSVRSAHSDTTFVKPSHLTRIAVIEPGQPESPVLAELRASVRACSFLALGVPGKHLAHVTAQLREIFTPTEVNITDLLLDQLRAAASEAGLPWDLVVAADAADSSTRDAQGLAALVAGVMPQVETAIDTAMTQTREGERPVLLTDAGPLARYGHLALLTRLADVTRRRANAVWLVVPQVRHSGPVLDGHTVQLSYGSQFLPIPEPLTTHAATLTSRGDAG